MSFDVSGTYRSNENKNVRIPQQRFVRQFASSFSSSSTPPPTPPQGDDSHGKKVKETEEKETTAKQHKKKASELYEEVKDKAEHAWEDTKEAASEAKETMADATSVAKEKVQEKLSTAAEKAKDVTETIKEKAQGVKAKVKGTKEVSCWEVFLVSLLLRPFYLFPTASYDSPLFYHWFLLFLQSAKHKAKEAYEKSAREYKKGLEETTNETMDGK